MHPRALLEQLPSHCKWDWTVLRSLLHGELADTSTFNSSFKGKDLERREGLGLLALIMTVRLVCI